MKITIIILVLLIFCYQSTFAGYVQTGDTVLKEQSLPKKWTFSDGRKTGNFDILSKAIHIAEGWREVTVDNSSSHDPKTQIAGNWVYTIFVDHAEKTRTVINKPPVVITLKEAKRRKGFEVINEARMILYAKYESDWYSGYTEDRKILRDYFNATIKLLIKNSITIEDVNTINYTWPSI